MKPVKYLVKGWNVKDGKYIPFTDIAINYEQATTYFQLMSVRNLESVHLKIDSIECIFWSIED